jgi:hypothetical protein
MDYHVITPLARADFFPKVKSMLEEQIISSKCSIIWDVIVDAGSNIDLGDLSLNSWIRVHTCPNDGVEFWKRCNNSINWYLDNKLVDLNAKYMFLNDDDFYEPHFFSKIDRSKSPIVICSMDRGHNTPHTAHPYKRHPTGKLIGHPGNMKVCMVGIEQIVIEGNYLKNYRLPLHVWGDGMMIEHIVATNTCVDYLPDTLVLFNYLEEGRWNK